MIKETMRNNTQGFSIIELMIGIFIFGLGLTSVFMMLSGTLLMSDHSRNLLVASNLANEEIELFKNIRDTNYRKVQNWLWIDPNETDPSRITEFATGSYYTLENNYKSSASFPIKVTEISPFLEGEDKIDQMEAYRLCLNIKDRYYTHDCASVDTDPDLDWSQYYRYLSITDAMYNDGGVEKPMKGAIKISATVIWAHRGYFSTEVSSIVTDWKKL